MAQPERESLLRTTGVAVKGWVSLAPSAWPVGWLRLDRDPGDFVDPHGLRTTSTPPGNLPHTGNAQHG